MRDRIRSCSHGPPGQISPVGSRETKIVPASAPAPILRAMRCQPGGVLKEFSVPPTPFRAVETGQAAIAVPPSRSVAVCRSTSTTNTRCGIVSGAPCRCSAASASAVARAVMVGEGSVTRRTLPQGGGVASPPYCNSGNGNLRALRRGGRHRGSSISSSGTGVGAPIGFALPAAAPNAAARGFAHPAAFGDRLGQRSSVRVRLGDCLMAGECGRCGARWDRSR